MTSVYAALLIRKVNHCATELNEFCSTVNSLSSGAQWFTLRINKAAQTEVMVSIPASAQIRPYDGHRQADQTTLP
jgi:hypothetical protein